MAMSAVEGPSIAMREPRTLAETGLEPEFVKDLIAKSIHFATRLTGAKIADQLCLPHPMVAPLLRQLRTEQAIDVAGSAAQIESAFEFVLTAKGRERTQHALLTNGYVGPAPVTLTEYTQVARSQGAAARAEVRRSTVQAALQHLVLP